MTDAASVPAGRREIFAWAMYDFANSSYTTIVLTAIFSAYFANVVAIDSGYAVSGAFLWIVATVISNLFVLLTAPVLGAIADHGAYKKRLLAISTIACVVFTAGLASVGPGDVVAGTVLLVLSAIAFYTSENLIAGFLPEIARPQDMGRISGYGWSLGFIGGLIALALCLAYVFAAEARGAGAAHYVPVTMWITAGIFGVATIPTFLWLRERAKPQPLSAGESYLRIGFARIVETWRHVRRYRDLLRFLIALSVYYCGIYAVIALAAVYAAAVMQFTARDTIFLILIVNITAAIGAFTFGFIQDRLGSIRTLAAALVIWIIATVSTYFVDTRPSFWIVANLIGIALGASQSAGRALVGLFSPPDKSAEFFGFWGLAGKLASVVGVLSYGAIIELTGGNHRLGLLSISVFFVFGLGLLLTVDEARGRAAAHGG